jgi:hypothetical protein
LLAAAAWHRDAHAAAGRGTTHRLLAAARGDAHDQSDQGQISQQWQWMIHTSPVPSGFRVCNHDRDAP